MDSKRSVGIVVGLLDSAGRRIVACGSSGTERPLDGDTVFEIASIDQDLHRRVPLSEMVRRKEVKLDDPFSKFLPRPFASRSKDGKQITLLHLATQTSGLPRLPGNLAPKDARNPYADYSAVEQMYDFLSHYELTRDIGEKYEYSNLGDGPARARSRPEGRHELRGARSQKRVLEPLGMKRHGDHADRRACAGAWRRATPQRQPRPRTGTSRRCRRRRRAALRVANDMLKFLAANLDAGGGPLPAALAETHRVRHATDIPLLDIGLAWHLFHRFDVTSSGTTERRRGYHSWVGFVERKADRVRRAVELVPGIDDLGPPPPGAGAPPIR